MPEQITAPSPVSAAEALAAVEKNNALLESIATRGHGAPVPAPLPEVVRAAAGEGGAPALKGNDALRQRIMANGHDAYNGKGLGFARIARAQAAMAREKRWHEVTQVEREFGLPEGSLSRSDEAQVEKMYTRASMSDSTPSTGGALAFDEYATQYIEVLRAQLAFLKAGVVSVPMDRQSLTIGRQTSDVSGSWIGEGTDLSVGSTGTDTLQLQLKKWGCLVAVSNDLLHDAVAADIVIRNSLLAAAQLALDLACIRGLGTAYTPKGLRYQANSSNVFSAAAGSGSNSLTTALTDLAKAQRVVEEANVPEKKGVFLMAPRTKWGLVQLRDGVGRPYFGDEIAQGKLMGKDFFTTSQIPTNLSGGGSGGSSESEITYFETSQAMLGIGLLPSIETSREGTYKSGATLYSAFGKDETLIRVILRADPLLMHDYAASVVTGVTLS